MTMTPALAVLFFRNRKPGHHGDDGKEALPWWSFALFGGLANLRQESRPDEWRETVALCRQHPLRELVHQDPFTSRAYSKRTWISRCSPPEMSMTCRFKSF